MPHWLTELLTFTHILQGLDVVCMLAIIGLVLLHSGRGGGVSDMFGGGAASAASGSTVAERNLDRYTIVFIIIFIFTTLTLAIRMQ